jgi:hypothetical protein
MSLEDEKAHLEGTHAAFDSRGVWPRPHASRACVSRSVSRNPSLSGPRREPMIVSWCSDSAG